MAENINLNNDVRQPKDEVQNDVNAINLMNGEEICLLTESENHKEIIENKELGIVYEETVIELPKQRQEETGIKRIIKKTVIHLPKCFDKFPFKHYPPDEWGDFDYDKCLECFDYLCNKRLINKSTFTHTFLGDHYFRGEFSQKVIKQFIGEGLYFQKIGAVNDDESTINDSSRFHSFRNSTSVFDFSVIQGWSYSGAWAEGLPMFVFGARNETFIAYLKSILSNPQTKQLLKESGWKIEPSLQVIDGNLDIEEKRMQLLESRDLKSEYENQSYKKGVVEKLIHGNNDIFIANGNPNKYDDVKNIEILQYLIDDKPFEVANWALAGGHPHIPIIKHPDIKPLRWCNAESAIIPTSKALNVLLFETE